ncbi:hypothetical protein YWIDRAFT_07963 [Streptomyces sp. SceaMP-e96]|uniref:hypothetical protein n=1 Tax=unclassified Streptomyces TaxID=2593676 RepID=UPI0008239E54|nr:MULTISPECIES: hypothetical protein [unclassified Streptomyces]MYT18272.1 hypothetical protein [Streptomyces sp. SID4951]SCK54174.1 hypothetical protein YWIDRAFT_07963 [Streptomyces sp. SceaMP-e96]
METYRTWLEVRFPDNDGRDDAWQRYDQVVNPYLSMAPASESQYDDDYIWLPGTPAERARDDLNEALDIVIDEQYLARVVREGTMDVRVRLLENAFGEAGEVVAVCTPTPQQKAEAYLSAAVRGYDAVRSDLRDRIRIARHAGVSVNSLIDAAASRVDADEIHALLEADRLSEAVREVIKGWPDQEGRTDVVVADNNSVHVLLRTSFSQEMNYEEMCLADDSYGYEDCEDGDWWGYKDGVRDAEALLKLLTAHYIVTRGNAPATAHDLAPKDPHQPGHVRITLRSADELMPTVS